MNVSRVDLPAVPRRRPWQETPRIEQGVDQREPGLWVVALPKLRRRFSEHEFKRWPDVRAKQVPANGRAVAPTEHNVRMDLWLAFVDLDISDEREHLDLLLDRY